MSNVPDVLVLYNAPRQMPGAGYGRESDAGVMEEVQAVSTALSKLQTSYRTTGIGHLEELPGILAVSSEPVIFNLVEELPGNPSGAVYVPAVCRIFGKAVTGCDTPSIMAAQDKSHAKAILHSLGIPVPAGTTVPCGRTFPRDGAFTGPFIVKPLAKDASEGINQGSVFAKAGLELDNAVAAIHRDFGQPALVEQYVGNRELNVSLFQDGSEVTVLPPAEIDFSAFEPGRFRVVDYAAKWLPDSFEYRNTPRIIPAPIPPETAERVRATALRAWDALDCRDYARVDLRIDEDGRLFILEVNSNPDISPEAGFSAALAAASIPYEKFVETLIRNASRRRTAEISPEEPAAPNLDGERAVTVRRTAPSDRDAILDFAGKTDFFNAGEIVVAREVLDEAMARGPDGHYQSYTAEKGGEPVGWVCFGPTPCTVGTYDIYWLVVSPRHQEKGIGRMLLTHAEELIVQYGGRLAIIDTSGHSLYRPTRKFYAKMGYIEHARIRRFYTENDDKIIYVKELKKK